VRIARDIVGRFAAGERGIVRIGGIRFELADTAACSEFVRECCEAAAQTQDHGPLTVRYFGAHARETESKLRARGTLVDSPQAVPGDIICFNRGLTSGYGHIGIWLGGDQVAENTSSTERGPGFVISSLGTIGRHRVSGFYHLPEFARGAAPDPDAITIVVGIGPVPDDVIACNARLEDGTTRVDLRPLVEGLPPARGYRIHDHTNDQRKAYIEVMGDAELAGEAREGTG
jgi:hypothetical protein